jgi:hypothetical protein
MVKVSRNRDADVGTNRARVLGDLLDLVVTEPARGRSDFVEVGC